MVNIQLPSQLSSLAAGHKCLQVQASNLGDAFRQLDEIAPMIRSQIFDTNGSIRQFVGLFLDEHQISDFGSGSNAD